MLPDEGTEPDGVSWEPLHKVPDRFDWVRQQMNEWRPHGMKWLRVTATESAIWLEVWKEVPRKEAPFKRHYNPVPSPDSASEVVPK